MSNCFSRLERELVLQYLAEEQPSLICNFEKKTLHIAGKSYGLVNAVLVIPALFFTDIQYTGSFLISFYYKGRGLYFTSAGYSRRNTVCIPVPDAVYKQSDGAYSEKPAITAAVRSESCRADYISSPLYTLPSIPGPFIFAQGPVAGFDTLIQKMAGTICSGAAVFASDMLEERLYNTLRAQSCLLYMPPAETSAAAFSDLPVLVYDAKNPVFSDMFSVLSAGLYIPFFAGGASSPGSSQVLYLPVTQEDSADKIKKLCMNLYRLFPSAAWLMSEKEKTSAVEGRVESGVILYLDDCCLITGDAQVLPDGTDEPAGTVSLILSFGLRTVRVQSICLRVFRRMQRLCREFTFTAVQEEDRRFLYEWYYGKLYR